MPSPLGHGIAALAAGWGIAGLKKPRPALIKQVAILVAIGAAPDLDLLFGRHSMETHSVGAAAIVASIAAWQRWPVASSRTTIWIAVALAWLSHPVIDALGRDTSTPIGVMALWPFSRAHFQAPFEVFGPISRRYWLDNFWPINVKSMAREAAVLAPVPLAVWWVRRQR